MGTTEEQVLILKGMVSELPEQDQKKIQELRATIRKIVEDNGDNGFFALAIVGPEIVIEKEGAQ